MAKIKDASLRAEGQGTQAVLTVTLDINWDRKDRDHRWEAVIRFLGVDAGLRGGDEVLKTHTIPVEPGGGEVTISVDNADGAFNEDRGGGDEVEAECTLHILQPDLDAVRTNKVKGNF